MNQELTPERIPRGRAPIPTPGPAMPLRFVMNPGPTTEQILRDAYDDGCRRCAVDTGIATQPVGVRSPRSIIRRRTITPAIPVVPSLRCTFPPWVGACRPCHRDEPRSVDEVTRP